jgi:hypothetical protein
MWAAGKAAVQPMRSTESTFLGPGLDSTEMRSQRPSEDVRRRTSPAPGGASGAIVRLNGRGEPGPRLPDPRAEFFAGREFRGDPAFGDQQLKSRPRAAGRADPVVQGLPVGLIDLVEVPGVGGIESNQIDRDRGFATGPPSNANPEHAAGRKSDHTEARAGTPARESSVVAPVVRAPIIHVARRGANQ